MSKVKIEPRPKCIVDFCKAKQSLTNSMQLCYEHGNQLQFLLWILPRLVKKNPERQLKEEKKSDLWTPESGEPSGIIKTE